MPNLSFHTTTRIWLSLEDFHNNGLSSEQTKEIIERIYQPFDTFSKLHCKPSGLNGNWIVEIHSKDPDVILDTVEQIKANLDMALGITPTYHHEEFYYNA